MTDTKLSNTYGFDRLVNNVPKKIENYIEDVHGDIKKIKKNSLYYSEMSIVGMLTCIILLVLGATFVFVPKILFEYIRLNKEVLQTFNIVIKATGVFLLLISVHGIGRMLFATKLRNGNKSIDKIGSSFNKQFSEALQSVSANQLIDRINNFDDAELSDNSALDDKLFHSMASIQSRDKMLSKLVLISRIFVPIILYAANVLVMINDGNLGAGRAAVAFIIMFIFCRRFCLLLEYKVGKLIRALMCIPSIVYGAIFYFCTRAEFENYHFLSASIISKLPEGVQPFVSSGFIVCLLQVVVLTLSVLFQDYYSERKYLREGVSRNSRKSVRKKWYIYYGIALYCFLITAFIIVLILLKTYIEYVDSIGRALLVGAIFGVVWRLISPIWPEDIGKTIRKYWGVKYSVAVELFVIVFLATVFFLSGFTFSLYSIIIFITVIITSWIVFAIMVHFCG